MNAGETYFTPAHTVHAIGAGIVLCEIQQNSDVTYRLWDYGRPRELHVEKAVPIADLGVHPGAVPGGVIRSRHFVTKPVALRPGEVITPEPQNCHLWICVEGQGTIAGGSFSRGRCGCCRSRLLSKRVPLPASSRPMYPSRAFKTSRFDTPPTN